MRASIPLWVTLAVCLFVGTNEVRHYLGGQAKLAEAALPSAPAYDIAVTLTVTPEPFHMSRLQNWGTMTGVHDRTVVLRRVPAARLSALAREPWIAHLAPAGS